MNGLAALSLCLLLGALPEGDPKKRVHDFAKVLPAETKTQLEALSLGVERDTTAQLAIVTVHSLDGKSIDEYATELFNLRNPRFVREVGNGGSCGCCRRFAAGPSMLFVA